MALKVAFQGVRGANSEVGIRQHFGAEVEAVGYAFSEDVFEAVLEGECPLGYVPVENSIAGNVAINMDLLYRHQIRILAEDYVPIRHCLLVKPGVQLKDLRRVYSHPVALEQCRPFLSQWGLTPMPDFDTAGAAAHLAERAPNDEAAIAPFLCAEYYGLELLSDDIQQLKTNITRFVVFTKADQAPKDLVEEKTSVAFMARHTPGALVSVLEQFGRHGLNMTRLESRPIPENPFAYIFFVDFIGSLHHENVRDCLAEMSRNTQFIKILGSYPLGRLPA